MNYTTFSTELSHLKSFNTIGYDKDEQTLDIHFFNGKTIKYFSVPEQTIFNLLISKDKEHFFKEKIQNCFSSELINLSS